ncbi:MAG: sugar phosphate isomerase/epimerase [Streptomyces sp.]|uniref:sugar phosphate isomerase/epimerase family protein n=1 Tax=Streptomyces sp. TaxID=1931 RepID=UPI0025CE6D4D|nr:sugar phosphate isomerase/epimerase [Streptomyces sp.]MBW8800119.1 sugar phosphate isomerase/epimerase [Streptomyces sp.]
MSTPQLSVQLYSVRHALEADEDATLGRLTALGLRNVEAFGFVHRAGELADALDKHGLSARTGHAGFLSPDAAPPADLDETFRAARRLGVEILFDPFVPAERWADEQEIARTAALLNEAAERAADHGLRVGYHNHSQEFVHTVAGVNAFDRFAGLLHPEVALEIDLFWAAAGGNDVVALLNRLGSRVRALHVKDGPVIDDPFTSGAPFDPADTGQVAAGRGQIPLAAALEAAPHAEYAVIEFDHYDGDIFEGIATGVSYLNGKGIA